VSGGVAAGGHPATCEAAIEVLDAGGNAYDAVVAASFVATVAEPGLTSLGGGGFCLARTSDGEEILFDLFVDTPGRGIPQPSLEPHLVPVLVHFGAADQLFQAGLGSVAVPGLLQGLVHVHRRLGRLPVEEVVRPASRLAEEGVEVNAWQAHILGLLEPIMLLSREGRELYAPGGQLLQEGDTLRNPALSAFLESVPSGGVDRFYRGDLAERVASDMANGFGRVTVDDLSGYSVIEREPLRVGYRGTRLLTNPAPSFGGPLIAVALGLLEKHDLAGLEWGSVEHLRALGGVMVETEARRGAGGTTHVSVVDGEENLAALSMSNGEGSGYLVPDTGVMLNNMMGEEDLHPGGFHTEPPGQRVPSMMSPTIVLRDGESPAVLGSGGSERIRTAILQVVSNLVDFGLPPTRAVQAPRIHWDGAQLQVEPGHDAAVVEALRHEWSVNTWTEPSVYFGGVHAVVGGAGAGDPRRGGSVVVAPR
jgi:gamma-glutamyltranspeptidase / glutathione hydrolase